MVIDSEQFRRSLLTKGFVGDNTDHRTFRHLYSGRYSGVTTKLSHGARHDITRGLLGCHKRQMKLDTTQQVVDFTKCQMSGSEYNEILIQKQLI